MARTPKIPNFLNVQFWPAVHQHLRDLVKTTKVDAKGFQLWLERKLAVPGNDLTYANKGTAVQVAERLFKEWKAKHAS